MVTSNAGQLGIFGPIFFVSDCVVGVSTPSKPFHRGSQLYCLTYAPIAHANPIRIFRRFARSRFPRRFPVPRLPPRKTVPFELNPREPGATPSSIPNFLF